MVPIMQITSEELMKHDDLEFFAEYLGIDYEDFYEMLVIGEYFEFDYYDQFD
tara:strand:- start:12600 stop:12755 length:156 start_codon:yes stop_codon:yes gene_type:complete